MRFIEQIGTLCLALLLAGAAIGCLISARDATNSGYAIAAAIFAVAFVHLLVNADRGGRDQG